MTRLLISAGEPSGDRHAAAFLRAFRERHPDVQAFGLGGPRLRAEGLECLARMEDLTVVGVAEVLTRLPRALAALRRLVDEARRRAPALVVPVDFPDFNLRLASRVRRIGLPVLYYVSPQVWAWREGRVAGIRRDVDRMAVVFPFEVDFYRERGYDRATFVGHPLLEDMNGRSAGFRARRGIAPGRPLVALFPGSRPGEVARHWGLLVAASERIRARRPDALLAVSVAPGLDPALLEAPQSLGILAASGEEHALLEAADAAAVAAGTATLEALLAGCPMAVFYRTSRLTYAVMSRAARVRSVALANLLGGPGTARELLQGEATPEALADEILALLADPGARPRMETAAARVREMLGGKRASLETARLAETMLWPASAI